MHPLHYMTIWFTGLSGAGKTTLARSLENALLASGQPCAILDGDALRLGLCKDLGFSSADRRENIRRAAELARLMNQAGLIAIVALISPLQEDRERARDIIGCDSLFEVHVATPLAVCEARDPKGLYQRARTGELANFTGISARYEVPAHPQLVFDTSTMKVEDCVDALMRSIRISHKRL